LRPLRGLHRDEAAAFKKLGAHAQGLTRGS
jgi:hypothetical protein